MADRFRPLPAQCLARCLHGQAEAAVWVAGYERAWRTPGVDALADLFTADAVYRQGPYETPVAGLPAIGRMWESERSGADEASR